MSRQDELERELARRRAMTNFDSLPEPLRVALSIAPYAVDPASILAPWRVGGVPEGMRAIITAVRYTLEAHDKAWRQKWLGRLPHIAAEASFSITELIDPDQGGKPRRR